MGDQDVIIFSQFRSLLNESLGYKAKNISDFKIRDVLLKMEYDRLPSRISLKDKNLSDREVIYYKKENYKGMFDIEDIKVDILAKISHSNVKDLYTAKINIEDPLTKQESNWN